MKRQYTIYNICVLLALLFLGGGWNDAWGQEYNNGWNSETDKTVQDKQTNLPNSVIGTSTETIYVIDDESFQLHLQDGAPLSGGVRDNFNGYIRWYNNATEEGSTANLSAEATTLLRKYKNGFYWAQAMGWGAGPAAPAGLITYKNSSIDDNNPETIVCEASSLTDYKYVEDSNWRRHYLTEGATVNVRKHFIIKSATNRESFLSDRKNNFSSKPWYTDLTAPLKEEDIQSIQDRKTGFPEVYAVHTPMEAGTSYRLAERLSNYIVKVNSTEEYHANQVRWRVFDSDGSPVTDSHCNIVRHNWNGNKKYEFEEIQMTNGSIILGESSYIDEKRESVGYQSEYNKPNIINFYYNLKDVDKTKQQHFYIMAEVRYYYEENQSTKTISDWYPISFITVYLEPNSEPLDNDKLPADRKPAALADEDAYKLLASMTFDDADDTSKPQADTNYPSSDNNDLLNTLFGADSETYYGFAMPDKYSNKKNSAEKRDNRFVGRGEYAFYKSLNIDGISPGEDQSDEIYYANWSSKSYKVKVTDRLHESKGRPENSDYGYFLYVDAADEAGLIAKLRFTEKLCQRTSLVGTAWICNLKATDEDGQSALNADIGFTLKGLTLNEDGTYTESAPLYKFYTGEVKNNPTTGTGFEAYAKWQQVYFKFNINENYDYDAYIVEVANNCRNSHGADYAVDQIEIRCTLPDITVQRENACESSTLRVSSDYNTLLQNMGWDVDPNVLDKSDLSEVNIRKYRYGLMGNDPYADVINSTVGNVYYGFTDKEIGTGNVSASVDNWITVNKDAYSETNETLKKLSKIMRVAVPTKDPGQGDLQSDTNTQPYTLPASEEEALKNEIIMNVRALNDFISDMGPKTINNVQNQTIWTSDKLSNFESLTGLTVDQLKNNLGQLCRLSSYSSPATTGVAEWVNVEEIMEKPDLNDVYEESIRAMYTFLQIPRIRCPWKIGDNIYLGAIDVENTDLKFYGEKIEGQTAPASGEYEVIVFGAQSVVEAGGDPTIAIDHINFNDKCLSHSAFIVRPSITITVDGEAQASGVTCYNSIHTLEADLWVWPVDEYGNDTGEGMKTFEEVYPNNDYTFDWFLGKEDDLKSVEAEIKDSYGGEKNNLQALLKACRDELLGKKTENLTSDAIEDSNFYDEHTEDAKLLIELLGDGETEPKLASGKEVRLRWVEYIIAMPYVPDFTDGVNIYSFCLDQQGIPLAGDPNVPELSVGFPNIPYDDVQIDNVPLRLGLRHLEAGVELNNIPIQEAINFGVSGGNSLGIYKDEKGNNDTDILLRLDGSEYVPVATLTSLTATNNGTDNKLSLTIKEPGSYKLKDLFKEGEIYSLYIPFGEYDSSKDFIEGSCEGYAVLQIKVVPEYLTWKGDGSDVWYNDDNWNQSTEGELYFDQGLNVGTSTDDANGSDPDLTKAFAPLYFTKITINPKQDNDIVTADQLNLLEETKTTYTITSDETTNTYELLNFGNLGMNISNTTPNIEYDMAVDTIEKGIKVVPYYGNKVDQIYFKPEATMLNQHLLDYQKAWVEFTLERNKPYWMASPLRAVYAGDMYAPYATGKQETPAFEDIEFSYKDDSPYHRWELPFYQKAWNKAVAYSMIENPILTAAGAVADGTNVVGVSAVKSNWSIEYNDVWVPYSIGKGFYMRVDEKEGGAVTVRLPKADKKYTYQQTKAGGSLHPVGNRTEAGQLATSLNDATVEVYLTKVNGESVTDVEAREPRHFLVGNPYMTYLNMEKFLEVNGGENGILNNKYWTLANDAPTAVVGTPDVPFTGDDRTFGSVSGTVKPMQAFFIEVKPKVTDEQLKVTFTEAMMSDTEIAATAETKAASFAATNPTLTITAERGETRSVAKLLTSDKAENGYRASEDAVVLLDSELDAPMVYTVAGSRAAQVNAVKEISNVGLGIYNENDDEATVTISGLSQMASPLYLYDAQTRKSVELSGDSYTMQITGDSHGRYYLRNSAMADELENTISIYSAQRGQVIVSALQPVREIKVFNVSGALVRQFSVNTTQYTFPIQSGLYIIYASDGEQEQTEKVIVR